MDQHQLSRFNFFKGFVDTEKKGLEIGPLTKPTFSRELGYNIQSLDVADTAAMRELFAEDPNIDVDEIVPIDWVWKGGPYTSVKGIPRDFDYVVSSHTIEHSLDVIQFLKDTSDLLAHGGLLMLVVPDKRRMFDFYRNLTTLGDVLMAHKYPEAWEMRARIDELEFASYLEGLPSWFQPHANVAELRKVRPERVRTDDKLIELLSEIPEWEKEKGYRDAHRWVFEPATLRRIIVALTRLGIVEFETVATVDGLGYEFMMVLRKGAPAEPERLDLDHYFERFVPPEHAVTGWKKIFHKGALRDFLVPKLVHFIYFPRRVAGRLKRALMGRS